MTTVRHEVVDRRRGNITPKLHLLESHVVSSMRRFRVGLGLLGEQGREGLHHCRIQLIVHDFQQRRT